MILVLSHYQDNCGLCSSLDIKGDPSVCVCRNVFLVEMREEDWKLLHLYVVHVASEKSLGSLSQEVIDYLIKL